MIITLKTIIDKEIARGDEASVIHIVDAIIKHAHQARASDIHIDPHNKQLQIRIRVDGVLQVLCQLPKILHDSIIARIKVMAGLRTDEHQAAQDGRLQMILDDKNVVDIRISIVPTYHGENAILRLLSDSLEQFSLDGLGFSIADQEKIIKAAHKSHGMILATGPTGSGKTTTLYALIKILNKPETSIITIEDPIEYSISGIEQIQVNTRSGLSFANGLRSILRQDPNIIMVGEIRDTETAGIAVNAALTGHLLLSTLHTNDAATTLPRLLDMKIEPFLVASTVNIAIAQRLVRRICQNCKKKKELSKTERQSLLETSFPAHLIDQTKVIYIGDGCDQCLNTGYRGRMVITEVLVVDNDIREAILAKASASDIKRIAVKNGLKTIMEDGVKKVLAGQTTFEEILRMAYE